MSVLSKTHVWHPVTLEERERYCRYVEAEASPSADFSFAAIYMWNETHRQEIAYAGERALVRIGGMEEIYYAYPIGRGAFSPILTPLIDEAKSGMRPLVIAGVPAAALPMIEAEFSGLFAAKANRNYADYLYSATSLATLTGKKLHSKRNHCNAFAAAHSLQIRPITEETRHLPLDITLAWCEKAGESTTVAAERSAIARGLAAFESLGLEGILLAADGQYVAFAIGEMLTDAVFCVRFEKTLPGFEGAYPLINREFVRYLLERHPRLTTINREDDMGLENLRRAKLSYHPTSFFEKYTLSLL